MQPEITDPRNGIAPTAARLIEATGKTKTDSRHGGVLGANVNEHETKIAALGRAIEAAFTAGQRDTARALLVDMTCEINRRSARYQAEREAAIFAAIDREPGGRYYRG